MNDAIEVRHCVTRSGKDVFDDWLSQLADPRAQAKVAARINPPRRRKFWRLQATGARFVRIADRLGPGYRVYYAMVGKICVLLLCGGDKRKQFSDIERARDYLMDLKERTGPHEA
jgi:putative addiction module killer protein